MIQDESLGYKHSNHSATRSNLTELTSRSSRTRLRNWLERTRRRKYMLPKQRNLIFEGNMHPWEITLCRGYHLSNPFNTSYRSSERDAFWDLKWTIWRNSKSKILTHQKTICRWKFFQMLNNATQHNRSIQTASPRFHCRSSEGGSSPTQQYTGSSHQHSIHKHKSKA
jgi:hypothetical protein